jgi:23S rRNA-/tRNA-specific pseudouridylate synthase
LFESRQIRKIYWALVEGEWDPRIRSIQTQIAPVRKGVFANVDQEGKAAHSTFQILGKSSDRSITWLSVWLKTGRTHQARLHCLKGGSPVIGDTLYGARETTGLFGLHARELQFVHPATQNMVKLSAPAPPAWEAMLEKLAS